MVMMNRILNLVGIGGRRNVRNNGKRNRTTFLSGENLEKRELMVSDLYVNTHSLWGGDVQPGDTNVPVAQFQMIGRKTAPTSLTFESLIGAETHNLVRQPELVADLYRYNGRGQRTLGPDGTFETVVARGSLTADGDVTFRFGGIGTVLAHRGVDLQVQVDIAPDAEDGMPIAFATPTVGFFAPRLKSDVYHIGSDNPVYSVNAVEETHVSFDLESPFLGSINPGENDVLMGTLRITSEEPVYISQIFLAVEGRHGDNTLMADVDRRMEDLELRNPLTGQVHYARPYAEAPGIEILVVENVYVDRELALEVQMDQEGDVRQGDRFRVHAVIEPESSGRTVNIGGLTGNSTEYALRAYPDDWNDTLVVFPGSVLSGNFLSVEIPELHVAVQAIGTTDTAVKNEDNITLLRFEARAEGGDLLFTQSTFYAAMGSLLNVQNFTLWGDTDGDLAVDTILQSGVSARDGRTVTFDSIIGGGFVIPEETSVRFEVHADVASGLMPDPTLQLGLLAPSVQAEELENGSSLPANQILVNTAQPSKLWKFVPQGDLFVTLDSTPVRSRQLLGGTLSDTVFRLQFRAQHEAIDVTDLQFTSRGSNARSIDRLELYMEGATTAFATATVSGCGSDQVILVDGGIPVQTFCSNMENGQLIIPEGETKDVLVRARIKTDEQGALSGETFQLFIGASNDSDNATGLGAIRARGRASSNNLWGNDEDPLSGEGEVFIGTDTAAPNREIVSNRHQVVLSKFTSFTNANPDADNTNVPTGISPFAQFRITTATNSNTLNGLNKAALDSFVFYVSATNVSMDASAFKLYNKADASTKVAVIAESLTGVPLTGQVTGNFLVRVSNLSASAVDAIFESGESSTLVLEGSILNAKVNPSLSSGLKGGLDLLALSWLDRDASTNKRFTGVEHPENMIYSSSYRG